MRAKYKPRHSERASFRRVTRLAHLSELGQRVAMGCVRNWQGAGPLVGVLGGPLEVLGSAGGAEISYPRRRGPDKLPSGRRAGDPAHALIGAGYRLRPTAGRWWPVHQAAGRPSSRQPPGTAASRRSHTAQPGTRDAGDTTAPGDSDSDTARQPTTYGTNAADDLVTCCYVIDGSK